MNQTLQLGPLTFPFALLLAMAALVLGMSAGRSMGRRAGIDAEPLLWRLLLVGAVVARLAFVLQFHEAYLKAPLDIIDVRDGGWTPLAGFAAAAAYAIASGLRRAPLRSPLTAALGTVALVWAVGTLVLGALSSEVTRMPALRMQALDGQTVALADFQGKPTVLNLWATWCPPCRREMPVLRQAQLSHPEITFVFANQGETADAVRKYLAAEDIALENVLLDAHAQLGSLTGSGALPTTLFYNAKGTLVERRLGELSTATLIARLESFSAAPARKEQ